MSIVFWENGKPVATNNLDEAVRLSHRIKIIVDLLNQKGYNVTEEDYNTVLTKMSSENLEEYLDFVNEVGKQAKKEGC